MIGPDRAILAGVGAGTRSTTSFDREGEWTRSKDRFWGCLARIQSDQPWADGLMQRSLFGWSGDQPDDSGLSVNFDHRRDCAPMSDRAS